MLHVTLANANKDMHTAQVPALPAQAIALSVIPLVNVWIEDALLVTEEPVMV